MSGSPFGGKLATRSLRRTRKSTLPLGYSHKCPARRFLAACCCRLLVCNAAIRECLLEQEAQFLLCARSEHTRSQRISVLSRWKWPLILARGRAQATWNASFVFFFVNCGFSNSRGLRILIRRPSGRCIASHTETNIHCCRTFSPLEQGRRISIGVDEAFPSRLMTPRILPVLLLAGEQFIDGTDSVCRPSEDYTLHCMMLERGDSWRSLGEDTSSYQTYDSSLMTSVVYIVQSFFRRP